MIQTLGGELAAIDFHVGFSVELASTATVVLATVLGGLPVSTTHCQVGAVLCVGALTQHANSGRGGVAWGLFAKIAFAWVLTLPLAALVSATLTAIFQALLRR